MIAKKIIGLVSIFFLICTMTICADGYKKYNHFSSQNDYTFYSNFQISNYKNSRQVNDCEIYFRTLSGYESTDHSKKNFVVRVYLKNLDNPFLSSTFKVDFIHFSDNKKSIIYTITDARSLSFNVGWPNAANNTGAIYICGDYDYKDSTREILEKMLNHIVELDKNGALYYEWGHDS